MSGVTFHFSGQKKIVHRELSACNTVFMNYETQLSCDSIWEYLLLLVAGISTGWPALLVATRAMIGNSLGTSDFSSPIVTERPRSCFAMFSTVEANSLPELSSSSSCGAMKYRSLIGMPPARGSTRPSGV